MSKGGGGDAEGAPYETRPRGQQMLEAIPVGKDGKLLIKNNGDLLRFCKVMVAGGAVPERFNEPEKLFAALMFVRSLNLPDVAIRQSAQIKGNMCIFGDLPLALCQRSEELEDFYEQWFDKEYNVISFQNKNLHHEVFGAVCFVKRKGRELRDFSFTMDDAEEAKLYPPQRAASKGGGPDYTSPWYRFRKMMLRYRARAIGLKSEFADLINGIGIAEYDYHMIPDESELKDVTPDEPPEELSEIEKIRAKIHEADKHAEEAPITVNLREEESVPEIPLSDLAEDEMPEEEAVVNEGAPCPTVPVPDDVQWDLPFDDVVPPPAEGDKC